MILKKFKPFAGPKVIEMPDPDSLRVFRGATIQELATKIANYRAQNELEPLDHLPETIENYLCSQPIHAGLCTTAVLPKRSVIQTVRGGIAVLKNLAYKSFVTVEEANRRAEACISCKHNVFPDKTYFITWINNLTEKSIGKLRSKHHDKLGICQLCSCPLRSKIFFNGKIKLEPEQLAQMKALDNPKCWQPEFVNGK